MRSPYTLIIKKSDGEPVHGLAVVGFTGFGDGLGPFGMMEGVGVELGLQADAGALGVVDAALADLI